MMMKKLYYFSIYSAYNQVEPNKHLIICPAQTDTQRVKLMPARRWTEEALNWQTTKKKKRKIAQLSRQLVIRSSNLWTWQLCSWESGKASRVLSLLFALITASCLGRGSAKGDLRPLTYTHTHTHAEAHERPKLIPRLCPSSGEKLGQRERRRYGRGKITGREQTRTHLHKQARATGFLLENTLGRAPLRPLRPSGERRLTGGRGD